MIVKIIANEGKTISFYDDVIHVQLSVNEEIPINKNYKHNEICVMRRRGFDFTLPISREYVQSHIYLLNDEGKTIEKIK